MDLLEFFLLLLVNCFLIVISLWKRMGLFNVFGILLCLLAVPIAADTVLYRVHVAQGTQIVETTVKANPTFMALLCLTLALIHGLVILKLKHGA